MARRLVDFVVAIVGLTAFSPLLLIVSALVRIDSSGPAFYRGQRVGRDGVLFRMWKFRTMISDADRLGPGITARSDPRITRIGGFLRRTKIDELPQLINLLIGDLTLVGPRAEVPGIVAHYTAEQREVLSVKPGITGPGQFYYTTDQEKTIPDGVAADAFYLDHLLDRKLRIDIDYIRSRTVASDLRLILMTVGLMIRSIARWSR